MVILVVLVVVLAVLGVLAHLFGADTRDGGDWQPYDLMAPRVDHR